MNYKLLSIFLFCILIWNSCYSQNSGNSELNKYTNNSALVKTAINSFQEYKTIHSFLIYKNERLISENYFNGFTKDSVGNLKSVSKSVLSALIGIAIHEGFITSIEQSINEFIPEYFSESGNDWRKNIKIKDLLTMSSGLKTTSGANYFAWITSDNWIEYALSRRKVSEPGELFHYSTGDTHLLSAVISKATGMSSFDFAQKYLFDEMGIELKKWEQDPQAYYLGGNNMYLTATDMGKFGLLYSNNGLYKNQQIVPKAWVLESTKKQINVSFISGDIENIGYGYLWWLKKLKGLDAKCAQGFGGQLIVLIEELDLVLVVTHDWDHSEYRSYEMEFLKILAKYVVPAFEENTE